MSTSSSAKVDLVINITDVLSLIPEYPGGTGEVEFMYFREACRNALAVLGPKHEHMLLIFLKTKLKDDAHMRFALRLPTYDKLSQFLCDVKHVYAPKCDEPSYWNKRMFAMRQRSEATPKYGAKFQELLSCATIAARHDEMVQAFLAAQESKEKLQKKLEMQQQQQQSSKKVEKQDSAASRSDAAAKRRMNLEEVMELINAPYENDNPKIETPASPEPRIRADKTLSIKGADYPQLEYPRMMPATTSPYKRYDREFKYDYKKDDEDDVKYELKPKTIVGKSS